MSLYWNQELTNSIWHLPLWFLGGLFLLAGVCVSGSDCSGVECGNRKENICAQTQISFHCSRVALCPCPHIKVAKINVISWGTCHRLGFLACYCSHHQVFEVGSQSPIYKWEHWDLKVNYTWLHRFWMTEAVVKAVYLTSVLGHFLLYGFYLLYFDSKVYL